MLALRLTRVGRPGLQLRRLLVALAAAGTGFLLLSALGYALRHPGPAGTALPRLAWCAIPVAATVHFALAVARTDPGTRPRPGLSAVGLGPGRLMAISALTTALSCTLGSLLALLVFLHLRGDLTGMPFDGAAAQFLAADQPLPLPAALTLLTVVPVIASTTVALALRPQDPRPAARGSHAFGRFGAYGHAAARETFGAYGRFGARRHTPERRHTEAATQAPAQDTAPAPEGQNAPNAEDARHAEDAQHAQDADWSGAVPGPAPGRDLPAGLPWGITAVAAGLAVQAYTGSSGSTPSLTALPAGAVTVLVGWLLTALGLVLAGPGLTHLCGKLLQSVRPGALRLLAGRVLMAEATRIGRPLGVVCAVAAAGYAMTALYDDWTHPFGPLSTLFALVVTGCTVATLLTAAVEARQCRADTIAALLRLGAPAAVLRSAAALRAGALLALFGPLTLVIANLAALPLARR
ncbi:hypothetical protein [Streptomyces sp. NPDC002676]